MSESPNLNEFLFIISAVMEFHESVILTQNCIYFLRMKHQ